MDLRSKPFADLGIRIPSTAAEMSELEAVLLKDLRTTLKACPISYFSPFDVYIHRLT